MIKELVAGDVCRAELKVSDSIISVIKKRLDVQQSSNKELMNAYKFKQQEVDSLNDIISNTEKIVKREVRKKNIWMYVSAALVAAFFIK